jgi:hypothetical protein
LLDQDDPAASRIRKMVIELVLLFAFAVALGVAVVKLIEWRLDVLYGPYIVNDRMEQKRRR